MKGFWLFITVACIAILTFGGCAPKNTDYLGYARLSFECEMRGELDGVKFEAHVVVGAPQSGEGARLREVTFLSPESLSGIKVSGEGSAVCVTLGDIKIENSEFEKMLYIADALCPSERVRGVQIEKLGERRVNRVEIESEGEHIIYIDPETSLPCAVRCERDGRDLYAEISWLEMEK